MDCLGARERWLARDDPGLGFRCWLPFHRRNAPGCSARRADAGRSIGSLSVFSVCGRRVAGRMGCRSYGEQRKLLVARVEDCERPGLLGQVVSIDLFNTDEDTARDRILRAASGAASMRRAKPSTPPRFPVEQGGTTKKPFPGMSGGYQHSASTTPSRELIIRTTTSDVGGPISISYEVGDKEHLEATVDYQDAVRILRPSA